MNGGEEVNIMNYSEILFEGTKKHQKTINIYITSMDVTMLLYFICIMCICAYLQLKENLYL